MPPALNALRLELELDSLDEPIQGHVANERGTRIPFTGWLELMAAIHRLGKGRQDEGSGG